MLSLVKVFLIDLGFYRGVSNVRERNNGWIIVSFPVLFLSNITKIISNINFFVAFLIRVNQMKRPACILNIRICYVLKRIEVRRLLEGGAYFEIQILGAALIRGRHLIEGGAYWRKYGMLPWFFGNQIWVFFVSWCYKHSILHDESCKKFEYVVFSLESLIKTRN